MLKITEERLDQLQQAMKVIEVDGGDGIKTASSIVGEETALMLLIFHVRMGFGSHQTYPPDPAINEKVLKVMRRSGFITNK